MDFSKDYVIDYNKIFIKNDRILKKRKIKKNYNQIKIHVEIVSEYDKEKEYYFILIKKEIENFIKGNIYIISLDLLEEVNHNLCLELLK